MKTIEKVDCKTRRNATDREMKHLLSLIALCQEEYPTVNDKKRIAEFNELSNYRKSIVKNRPLTFIKENCKYLDLEDRFSIPMN